MKTEEIDALFTAMIRSAEGVSDLLFIVGKPPLAETHGKLKPVACNGLERILTGAQVEEIATYLMRTNPKLEADMDSRGSCDCSYALGSLARFRVNVYKQNGSYGVVMRQLQSEIPTLEKLGLPPVFGEMIKEKTGIVFLTGGTGSGKTTTLAAMLNELNRTQEIHIVTLEDPIEYLHPQLKAAFSQRELGKDFPDFANGLRAALRQAPKVILVGEIRDRESMEIALTASETGHVVFSTLHTVNAGQTINRILGMFSKEEQQQVRERLADTLRYIVSQRLVSKVAGGRLLVTEIMGSSLRTRETLLYGEGENRSFNDIIEAGGTRGWHSFDQSLIKAFEQDLISEETAIIFCNHKNKMRRDLDAMKTVKNVGREQEPSGLRLDPVFAAKT